MTPDLILVALFTATIHFVGTLALSVRIVGVRTGLLVLSLALFNVMALVSRTANTFQAPLLTKYAETVLARGEESPAAFRILLGVALLGSVAGAMAVPTFQRVFSRVVEHYAKLKSWPRVLKHAVLVSRSSSLRRFVKRPDWKHVRSLGRGSALSPRLLVFNAMAVALLSTGVFSAIYAGVLDPELRATCITLSAVVNGAATLLLFLSVDPAVSLASEEALAGSTSIPAFRRGVVQLTVSRIVGVALAQVFLVPGALVIVAVARWI
ncbi:MAG: DUF2837 family protein [bacterium]|nr:DUF2837 family protein [bacterium]